MILKKRTVIKSLYVLHVYGLFTFMNLIKKINNTNNHNMPWNAGCVIYLLYYLCTKLGCVINNTNNPSNMSATFLLKKIYVCHFLSLFL